MMLTPSRLVWARNNGVSFVCSLCENFWRGIDNHQDGCLKVIAPKSCSGPMNGQSFPEYKGVLTPESMAQHCFVCGDRCSNGVVISQDYTSIIGVCEKHVGMLSSYSVGEKPPASVTKEKIDLLGKK